MIEQWYAQYAGEITRFAQSKGFSPEDADDLCAEVFLEAIRAQPADIAPRAWLHLVARNRMIEAWRRTGRRPTVPLEEWDAADEGIEGQAETDDERARLREQIAQLVPCHQLILGMRFVQDLSLQECARALSTTLSAVKSRQVRALRALRRLTEPEAAPEPQAVPTEPEPLFYLDNRAALLERCLRLEMEVQRLARQE